MKKIYLVGSMAISSFISLKAQPILTSANTNPQIGESFKANLIDYVSPGSAGANVTWDFANLASSSSEIGNIISPASTTHEADFPGANVATVIQNEQNYAYYIANSTSLSIKGMWADGLGAISYTDPEQHLAFPFTFNSTFTDNFAGTFTITGITVTRTGTVKVTADGYGTLILPFGTLNNVLRVQVIENYQDVALGGTTAYTDTSYEWILPGIHSSVMNLQNSYMDGTPSFAGGSYLDKSSIGIKDFSGNEVHLAVFPNPATSYAKVAYTLANTQNIKVSLTNLLGQTVTEVINTTQAAGEYSYTLDLKTVEKGLYLLQVQVGTRITARKLLIE